MPNQSGAPIDFGLLVKVVADGIDIAGDDEAAFGIVSATPGIILGDTPLSPADKYLYDEWGQVNIIAAPNPAYVEIQNEIATIDDLLANGNPDDFTQSTLITITGTSEVAPNRIAFNAIDNVRSPGVEGVDWTQWETAAPPTFGSPQTGVMIFGDAIARNVTRYSIITGPAGDSDHYPNDFLIAGSNDGVSWTNLDIQPVATLDGEFTENVFDFVNTDDY